MGEKGNVTANELASAASATSEATGLGAVVAGAGTTVTAVFSDTADTLRDKVIDKGVDAAIAERQRRGQTETGDGPEAGSTPS